MSETIPYKARLTEDIISVATRYIKGEPLVYGVRHEHVTVVADHDNVAIVESKKGDRFPVIKTKLQAL